MQNTSTTNQPALKRSLSLPLLVMYGVGTILGAGIYVLAGKVAGESGYQTPYAFVFAAIIVSCSAHAFAQLSKQFPASAGPAAYVQEVLRWNWLATTAGWAIIFTGVVSSATIARGFAAYVNPFFEISDFVSISILIAALTLLAIWGVSQTVWFAAVLTTVEIIGIAIVNFLAAPDIPTFLQAHPEVIAIPDLSLMPGIVLGAFLAFYAFIGFEDIVSMAEEVKNPRRNVALAVYLALIISTVIYFFTALSLMTLLPMEIFIGSDAPFADVAREQEFLSLGLITGISVAAITNGALVQIVMAARILYGMAKRNLIHHSLAKVNSRTRTPIVSTVIVALVVLVFAQLLPITILAKTTTTVVLLIFSVMNICLFCLHWQNRGGRFSLQTVLHLVVALLGLVLCLGFLVFQFWNLFTSIQ